MFGAQFFTSPPCLPGTRTAILEQIRAWLRDIKRQHRLLWLHGLAGAGKSSIMRTLAELEHLDDQVLVTLVLSRMRGENNPSEIFPSLAYQLAARDETYREYLIDLMERNPGLPGKTIIEQFKHFVVEPFIRKSTDGESVGSWLIMVDGLDECGNAPQCEILQLIGDFTTRNPAVPALWIISGRPKTHLEDTLMHIQHLEIAVPTDSKDACDDVKQYLRHAFEDIRRRRPIMPRKWPTEDDFLRIAMVASGHFSFASAVIKFVDDPILHPVRQLTHLAALCTPFGGNGSEITGDSHASLDELYTNILQQIPPALMHSIEQLLRLYLTVSDWNADPPRLEIACNILGLNRNVADHSLRLLYYFLGAAYADGGWTIEPTFINFLQDPSRSGNLAIDMVQAKAVTLQCCTHIVQQVDNSCKFCSGHLVSISNLCYSNSWSNWTNSKYCSQLVPYPQL